jgi:phospholipase/carboxylesterase
MSETEKLETIAIGPAEAPAVFLILHGLGADGHDFEPVAQHLVRTFPGRLLCLLPHAPVRPVTVNGGYRMRAWYDILAMGDIRELDWESFRESRAMITTMIRDLRREGRQKVFLGGFSQGGALSLYTGLEGSEAVDGIAALSGYWPHEKAVPEKLPQVPVFIGHGTEDAIVPAALAQAARKELEALGITVDYREYPMPHSVCPEEIEDLQKWLARQLEASG